jgi:D-arabinose 1-dehydrogenase-like Zn-dependent alcohol dehydrogenase
MKVMSIAAAGQPFREEERATPEPALGEVRIKIYACGVCHSEHLVKDGMWQGQEYPRVPGHEIAGVIDALGEGVDALSLGDRVGVGWHGGHDGTCPACLAGHFQKCDNSEITGITKDGGFAEYLITNSVACAPIPDGMDFVDAAPLLCAGLSTFNPLRNSGGRPGDLLAIQGIGGLGHMGIQYARAMGFEVVAISRGADKEPFARELGAHHYIDTDGVEPAVALQKLGGAQTILATAPHAPAISALVPGLAPGGSLMIVGVPAAPVEVNIQSLVSNYSSVRGWSSGTANDSADTLAFSQLHGIRSMNEVFPMAEAEEAYNRMMAGKVRFKAVLKMD